MSSPSRLRALRPYLLAMAIPAVLAVLVLPGTVSALLVPMWVVLLGTVGLAATSRGPQRPSPWNPRGRLLGEKPFYEAVRGTPPQPRAYHDFRGR